VYRLQGHHPCGEVDSSTRLSILVCHNDTVPIAGSVNNGPWVGVGGWHSVPFSCLTAQYVSSELAGACHNHTQQTVATRRRSADSNCRLR